MIEKQEYDRLEAMRSGLANFSLAFGSLAQQNDSLHKLLEIECSVVDPIKDVQAFIQKNSTFPDNDRLRNLYKELNLYQPLNANGDANVGPGEEKKNLNIEKTSRSMA